MKIESWKGYDVRVFETEDGKFAMVDDVVESLGYEILQDFQTDHLKIEEELTPFYEGMLIRAISYDKWKMLKKEGATAPEKVDTLECIEALGYLLETVVSQQTPSKELSAALEVCRGHMGKVKEHSKIMKNRTEALDRRKKRGSQ